MDIRASIEIPEYAGHPNRRPFEGCLTLLDSASDKAPSGAREHRVILTSEAVTAALPSLLGMAVSCKFGWDGHNAQRKCGIITSAWIENLRLMVAGYIFDRDFPEIEPATKKFDLGMSYELADAHVEDMNAKIWKLVKATFTGAAILLRSKAAYQQSSFRLCDPSERALAA